MLAFRLLEWQRRPELVEVPVPVPGAGEILIDVEAAGVCHTDLHLAEWPPGTLPYHPPFTIGHEVSGVVRRLGPGATGVSEGDRVVVYSRWGCGVCWQCLQGRENLCGRPVADVGYHGAGLGRDGGLAEQMVVPSARYLVPIGDLDAALAAPLADAGITPYHAIAPHRAKLRPGSTVVVIGAGGLGNMAVQILKAVSPARIIVVDPREQARAAAVDAGADLGVDGTELTPQTLGREIGGAGAALALDFVGTDATLALAAGVVGVDAAIVYVGRGGGTLPVKAFVTPWDTTVTVSSWGTIAELHEVVGLARAGAIRAQTTRYPLDQAPAAYQDLADGGVVGRAVVCPAAQ